MTSTTMVGVVLTFSCMVPAGLSTPPHLPHCQSFNQSPILPVFLWYDMSVIVCTTPVMCLIILPICISNTLTSVHTYTVVITEDLPQKLCPVKAPRNDEFR